MRLGHALLSVFVGKDRGSCSVKMRVVIGMVEVPVGVDDAFHRSVAKAIESRFELGPGGQNESVPDEFAVGAVEDYHASAGAGEHSDIVSKLLRLDGGGVELGAYTREQIDRRSRLLCATRCVGAEHRRVKEVRQKGAAGQNGRILQHFTT